MRVANTDNKYHLANTPEKCIQEAKREKQKMYLEACLQPFLPFSASTDGLLGVEAGDTLKMISSCLATKWQQP